VHEGDRLVAANSAPCGGCRSCLGGRANLCEHLLFVNGAYGEFITLPARLVARNVVKIARSTSPARAAFAEPLACALLAVERARVEAGETVMIFGHGPLGCLLGMAARARKARVIVVGKRGWRLDQVRNLGIAACLDATASRDLVADVRAAGPIDECVDATAGGDLVERLRALTGGVGPDVTIDATGRAEVWEVAVNAVGRGGRVVFFGGCAPGTAIRLDTRRVHYEELTLLGAFHHTPETIRRAVDLIESEAILPDRLLTHRMGLGEVPDALELMVKGEALKVLIEP
jgi:L-iditol 2-dehydrogenase